MLSLPCFLSIPLFIFLLMCRLNSFPRLTPWWRRCLTCSVASGDSLAVRSCCYRNHHLQTTEDGVGMEFVQVCVCNYGENRQLSGFCRQKSQSNTTLVISLSSSVSILTHRKNSMANSMTLTHVFSFSSSSCAMKTNTIADKTFFCTISPLPVNICQVKSMKC